MNHNYVDFDPNGADDEVRATQRDHMKEIKRTPDAHELLLEAGAECMSPDQYETFEALLETQPCLAARYVNCIVKRLPIVADMATVLEMLAAEADAGTVMIPSALRLTIDAALIKAGRKAAPTAVRHVTIAGVRDE